MKKPWVEKLATYVVLAYCLLSFTSSVDANKDNLPRFPGAALLVTRFPDNLAVTVGEKTTQIQGGGDWAVIPSISADGRVVASARMVPDHPPESKPTLIVGTYDIADSKWTDYKGLAIKGGTVAISPDGSRLACSYMATGPPLLHILDLKTGKVSVGPEASRYAGSLTWSPDNQRIAFVKEDGDVDVFGEAFNQAIAFRQRGSAFEEQAWAAGLQFVEERVERPTNPEVLFDILFVCSEAGGSANKEIAALIVVGGQYGLKTLGHLLLEPLAFLMIGAGARLERFALSVGGGTTALTC
jgi:WD40-like Beta Propeller Repeat